MTLRPQSLAMGRALAGPALAVGALLASSACASGPAYRAQAAVAQPAAPLVPTSTITRYRVYSARVALIVDSGEDRRAAGQRAEKIAKTLGGYVAETGSDGFVMRVPTPRLDSALDQIGALGRVVDRRVWAEEVTEQYVDMSVRQKNLRALRDRLQALLARAETVSDVLPIEKELARVTEELERLEGRLRVLSDQIQLARIDVEYRDDVSPGPVGWIFYGIYSAVRWLFIWD